MNQQTQKPKQAKVKEVVAPIESPKAVEVSISSSLEYAKNQLLEVGKNDLSLALSVKDAVEAIDHALSRVVHINKAIKAK